MGFIPRDTHFESAPVRLREGGREGGMEGGGHKMGHKMGLL